jgi:hypothetical protein
MLDPIRYKFLFLFTTLADPEPEPKLRYFGSSSGSGQKFWLLASPAPQHCDEVYLSIKFQVGEAEKRDQEDVQQVWEAGE